MYFLERHPIQFLTCSWKVLCTSGKNKQPPYRSLLMTDLLTKEENKHLQQQLAQNQFNFQQKWKHSNCIKCSMLMPWHCQIEAHQAPLKTRFFFMKKRKNPQKYNSFHNHTAVLGTACLVHNQLWHQTKTTFSFSWREVLWPNKLRTRD